MLGMTFAVVASLGVIAGGAFWTAQNAYAITDGNGFVQQLTCYPATLSMTSSDSGSSYLLNLGSNQVWPGVWEISADESSSVTQELLHCACGETFDPSKCLFFNPHRHTNYQ